MAGATTLADPRPAPSAGTGSAVEKHHFRADIQGLRAVAVGLVVAAHVTGWPTGGFIGVDVFFVISGFLITGLLVRERARTGRISFGGFYARRARRLLPAAFATLAATTVAAYYVFLEGRFQETLGDVVWAALFSANVNFALQGTDYFALTAAPSTVQHFWSLAVEEQFYLVWPGLILLAFAVPLASGRRHATPRRVGRTGVLWVLLGAVTAASFAWSVHATSASPATAYFSTFTRAWELGVGALVAVSATQLRRLPAAVGAALAWAGLATVFASAFAFDERTPFPGSAAALPVLGTALVLAWGSAPGGPGARWALGSAPAGFVGAISYSLYLWHWPVLVVAGVLLAPGTSTFYAVALAGSLALATVSYYCIEQPVLHSTWLLPRGSVRTGRARHVFRRAGWVGAAAAAVAAASVVAALLVPQDGTGDAQVAAARAAAEANAAVDSALTPLQQDLQEATLATEWPQDLDPGFDELPGYLTTMWAEGCLLTGPDNVDECRYGDADATRTVAVLGDSFAASWLPALRASLVPQGWAVQSLTLGLCPNITAPVFYEGRPYTGCAEHREWAIDHILEQRPDMVVLSHSWKAGLARGADLPSVYQEGLRSVVERLKASGAEIVLLGAPPGSASLLDCATSLNGPHDCLQGPSETFAQQIASEQQIAAETGVRAVDPGAWFCINMLCPTIVGSTPVYPDGGHMTAEYSRRIAPEVAAALLGP